MSLGHVGGSVVKRLPSAQVMIPGSWDRAPHRAPCSEGSLLLPLPLPLLVFPLSLSLSLCQKINKIFKKKKRRKKKVQRIKQQLLLLVLSLLP